MAIQHKVEVIRKSDNKLVYGNSGGAECVDIFNQQISDRGFDNADEYVVTFSELPCKEYIRERKAEYGSVEDQLDEIYWDFDAWLGRIASVKEKYPKPE